MSTTIPRRARVGRAQWLVPAGLILVSLIPILAGSLRLTELGGAVEIRPGSERFIDSPIPVVVHIVSVTVYAMLGAFQFLPALRDRRSWQRVAGRVLIPAGLLVALSALWMALLSDLPPTDGTLLRVLRLVLLLVFGSAMLASILLGTQAFLLIIPELFGSPPDALTRGVLSGAAWMLNLVIAESVIRRRVRANARGARR